MRVRDKHRSISGGGGAPASGQGASREAEEVVVYDIVWLWDRTDRRDEF